MLQQAISLTCSQKDISMKKIVELISSARGAESFSSQLADAVVAKIEAKYDGSTLVKRDLVEENVPHISGGHLGAFFTPEEAQTEETKSLSKYSDEAIAQLQASDTIVIGVPFYNFGIPSALKAYIDQIARAGKTFKYVDGAPVGLLTGKKVYLCIATGGVYSEGDYKPFDFAEPYLRAVLGFLGITDITTFRIEGVAVAGLKETAVQKGLDSIAID